ncbi:BamA/TamA family outer membrane protein [Novosphingobium sp.]|uniref:autotransporter assembly complex protein TamA n=1 Tax=Novosphingobium sp. TaxID=1874826 RepID=UPI0033412F47
MVMAGLLLLPAPVLAQQQTGTAPPPATVPVTAPAPPRATEPGLSDLIPDSALADPEHWALDTDAARSAPPAQGLPDVTTLDPPAGLVAWAVAGATAGDAAPAGWRGLTIAWPDQFDIPPITPLTPDPDIAGVASAARDAGTALDVAMPRGGAARLLGPDVVVRHVGSGIDLVLPPDAAFPESEDLADRFEGLSSLRALGRGDDNLAQLSRRAHDDVAVLQQILRLYGYYDAEVSQNLIMLSTAAAAASATGAGTGTGAAPRAGPVRFEIIPGTRYRIATMALGDVAQSPDHAALMTAFALKVGDPANTDSILAARGRLADQLGAIGHAFATVGDPALAIDHDTHGADLALPVTTGGTYLFGQVTSSLPKFLNARHLQRMARFRSGKLFDRWLVDDFRQAVLSTGIIGGVVITPREVRAPTATAPGVADLDVRLTKGPQHNLTAQIGQSAGQGFEIDGSWEDRNFFPPEGMVRVRAALGTRQQLIGTTFRRSNFLARDQAANADLYAQSKTTDAYSARTLSAIASLDKQSTLLFQKKWAYSFGVQIIATRELLASAAPGTPFTTYFIGALPLKLAFDGSNNLLDPVRGFRIGVAVSPAISIQGGPRSSYVTTQLDASAYRPIGDAVVVAGRLRLASISGTTIGNIAPSQRLYAGGGASIRGFAYQGVGPRDATNTPIGGRSLAEFSLEARVRTGLFDGGLSVVPFVDAGMVGTTPNPTMRGAKIGAGIGIRYKTNFGPIRFDIGTPLNRSPGDSRIGVYIALGQAF